MIVIQTNKKNGGGSNLAELPPIQQSIVKAIVVIQSRV